MDEDAVFRRYDVRGEYPDEIDPDFAELLGKAVGTFSLENYSGKVAVCRDNKQSSGDLKKSLMEGIKSTGAYVLDAGEGPTDYAAFSGIEKGAVTVQVTSSHLPLDTNGFKLIYPEGNGFLNSDLDRIEEIFRSREFREGEGETREEKMEEEYLAEAEAFLDGGSNPEVVVDSLGGASRTLLPELLERTGAEVIDISEEKDVRGPYRDPPHPEPGRLEELEARVEEEGADLGIATDMDGDRLLVYRDRWITGDELFASLVKVTGAKTVVASVDTSREVENAVEENGGELVRTRVGDPFVADAVLENGADLGGEPNGHFCFPGFILYNSGTLAAAVLASNLEESGLGGARKFHTREEALEVEQKDRRMEEIRQKLKSEYEVVSETDGVKFQAGESTVLVRPSGTSDKIRLKVDSEDRVEADRALEETVALIRNQ